MTFSPKALLAIACTAALSACNGEDLVNKLQELGPLILEEPGLYQAQLLSGTGEKSFNMLPGQEGVVLIYPQDDIKKTQRWGVWLNNTDAGVVTRSQWLGVADQVQRGDKYGVTLTRHSERFNEDGQARRDDNPETNTHNFISAADQIMRDVEGKEVKRWVFDFRRVGSDFSANETAPASPLYPQWDGFVALNPVPGGVSEVGAGNWVTTKGLGDSHAMSGKVETVIAADGKLNVRIEMPAAGCTLLGTGEKPVKGLNKLTFDLTSPATGSCVFNGEKVAGLLEGQWMKALAKAKIKAGTATAYTTAFTAAGQDRLVIGFPEMAGLMLTAGKQ